MARKSTPQPLTLADTTNITTDSFSRSPLSPISPKSPRSPFSKFNAAARKTQPQPQSQLQSEQLPMQTAESQQSRSTLPSSQTAPSLSTQQQTSDKQDRDRPSRGGFFSNYKAAKSSSRLQQNAESARQAQEDNMSRDTDRTGLGGVSSKDKPRSESSRDRSMKRRPVGGPKSSDPSLSTSDNTNENPPTSSGSNGKKNKPKPFNILNRTRSLREEQSPKESSPPNQVVAEPEHSPSHLQSLPLRTAPPQSTDRSFREIMSSNVRQRSLDRKPAITRDASQGRDQYKESGRHQPSFSTTGHTFLSNLRGTAVKGAGALSKGLFGKGGRSGSTNEREHQVDDDKYVLKVINLGLVEQTRITRISKRLEDSRDKTEFWMPALPWRAIDYLNYKGSDVEGLYRVPGSTPEIKKWQRKFDEEHDIDLFEQQDLYDINIIGSMLKQWLRELPDELLPKAAQDRVSRAASGAESVPQALIDELSNLPPFNYYLLFAITCHLSLLLAHSNKNKMNFQNLCICFQPCMKMDLFCFRFLVCEWRDCWKGCKTEDKYIALEYATFDPQPPNSAEGSVAVESHDDRNLSSSDSSKPSTGNAEKPGQRIEQGKGGKLSSSQSGSNLSNTEKQSQKSDQGRGSLSNAEKQSQKIDQVMGGRLPLSQSGTSLSTIQSTTLTVKNQTPPRKEMRPLSPIKPLSPIGL